MHSRSAFSYRNIIAFTAIFSGLVFIGRINYVLMHTLSEMFSIIVAGSIFLIAWNTRRIASNSYILFLGISFLFVSLLDLFHTLAYKGLNAFPGFVDANLPTQLWVAARYTGSISLLIAPLLIDKKLRLPVVFGIYGISTGLLLFSIFVWGIFPECYREGQGLTHFKIGSEYVICVFFLAALGLLIKRRDRFVPAVFLLLAASTALRIVTELMFTLYTGVFDAFNMAGHFFKVLSFYLFYKALVVAALVDPYTNLFRQLAEKTRELERSNAELEQFASLVSHDLKEPLSTIGGFAELLHDRYSDRLDGKGRGHLIRIVEGTLRMERLINGLLSFSRITTKGRQFEEVPLDRALGAALENIRSSLNECNAVIETAPLPVINGDEVQLIQLFQNLIANAVKYRGPEIPWITITARPLPRVESAARKTNGVPGAWHYISVADNGIGIDSRDHDRIFRMFERVRTSASADGNGIGLAVCKKIVERHGGKIWVESEPGKGATFNFTIAGL
jgi:signal transduction histidine kinase